MWPVFVRFVYRIIYVLLFRCPGIPFGSTLHLPGSAVPGVSICASIRSLQILPKGQLICCLDPYCLRYAKACWCLRDSAGRYGFMAIYINTSVIPIAYFISMKVNMRSKPLFTTTHEDANPVTPVYPFMKGNSISCFALING